LGSEMCIRDRAKAVPYFKPGKELRELINQRMPSA